MNHYKLWLYVEKLDGKGDGQDIGEPINLTGRETIETMRDAALRVLLDLDVVSEIMDNIQAEEDMEVTGEGSYTPA